MSAEPLLAAGETVATALWAGAGTGFAFLSPITFHATPDRDAFAAITERSLARLARVSYAAGGVACAAALARRRPDEALCGLAGLALVAYQQRAIVPAMTAAQRALGSLGAAADDDPSRLAYRALHRRSTRVYGAALLLGYAQLALAAARGSRAA